MIQSIRKFFNMPIEVGFPSFKRDAAKRTGSMINWNPQKLFSTAQEARDREDIVARSINLIQDDPAAAGIIETFATMIIGYGLKPKPAIAHDLLSISLEESRDLERQIKSLYKRWELNADAGGLMTDGEIQNLKARCLFAFGESLEIIHMLDREPFSMCSQIVNPLRLKTPTDKQQDKNIRDGIEIDAYGNPVAYWIKKVSNSNSYLSDHSNNFFRIPRMKGHRHLVLHDYITKEPEQFRGYPLLTPAMRYFKNLGDLLGAELTSNVITASMALFVETDNSGTVADAFTNTTDYAEDERIQEMQPGAVWYGSAGEKPHLLSAARPGTTFEPFTRLIKKTIATATGIPYQVLMRDFDGISFAGYRSAMLEAWRVVEFHRKRLGQGDCRKKYRMLVEEAYLRDYINVPDFYENIDLYTAVDWIGTPKRDIEPFKAIQADLQMFNARVKPLEQIIIENGGSGFLEIASQIEEEMEILRQKGLLTGVQDSAMETSEEEGNENE